MKIMKLLSDLHGSFPDISKKHNKYFFIGKIIKNEFSCEIIDENNEEVGLILLLFNQPQTSNFHFHNQDGVLFVTMSDYKRYYVGKDINVNDLVKVCISETDDFDSLELILGLEPINPEVEIRIKQESNHHEFHLRNILLADISFSDNSYYIALFYENDVIEIKYDSYLGDFVKLRSESGKLSFELPYDRSLNIILDLTRYLLINGSNMINIKRFLNLTSK